MTLYDLWFRAPKSFVFVRDGDNVWEYKGTADLANSVVLEIKGTKYPNYDSVIEVKIR